MQTKKEHRAYHAAYMKVWMAKQKEDGLCVECKQLAEPDRIRCAHHLKMDVKKNRTQRARWLAVGKCGGCGKEKPAGGNFCRDCAAKARNRQQEYYAGNTEKCWIAAGKVKAKNKAVGLCNCGREREEADMKCCITCRLRDMAPTMYGLGNRSSFGNKTKEGQ